MSVTMTTTMPSSSTNASNDLLVGCEPSCPVTTRTTRPMTTATAFQHHKHRRGVSSSSALMISSSSWMQQLYASEPVVPPPSSKKYGTTTTALLQHRRCHSSIVPNIPNPSRSHLSHHPKGAATATTWNVTGTPPPPLFRKKPQLNSTSSSSLSSNTNTCTTVPSSSTSSFSSSSETTTATTIDKTVKRCCRWNEDGNEYHNSALLAWGSSNHHSLDESIPDCDLWYTAQEIQLFQKRQQQKQIRLSLSLTATTTSAHEEDQQRLLLLRRRQVLTALYETHQGRFPQFVVATEKEGSVIPTTVTEDGSSLESQLVQLYQTSGSSSNSSGSGSGSNDNEEEDEDWLLGQETMWIHSKCQAQIALRRKALQRGIVQLSSAVHHQNKSRRRPEEQESTQSHFMSQHQQRQEEQQLFCTSRQLSQTSTQVARLLGQALAQSLSS